MENDGPSSSSRSRREKKDKFGRFAALQKLKNLKGSKHKYEVEEIDNVYDVVDDRDFAKTVVERQQDDWIVDDGDGGYVEDGREIFDDDLDDESIQKATKSSLAGPKKRKHNETKTKGNILNMLQSMPSKKTEAKANDDDDILGSMLKELETKKPSTPKSSSNRFAAPKTTPKPIIREKKTFEEEEDAIFDFPKSRKTKRLEEPQSKPPPTPSEEPKPQNTSPTLKNGNQTEVKSTEKESSPVSDPEKPKLLEPESETSISQATDELYSQYTAEFPDDDFECPDVSLMPSATTLSTQPLESTQTPQKAKVDIPDDDDIDNLLSNVEMLDYWTFQADKHKDTISTQDPSGQISVDLSTVVTTNSSGDSVLRFFWLDASEDPYRQRGVVNLFGKVHLESTNTYVSCCVTVKNIPRRIYILPRETLSNGEPNSMMSVYEEFNDYASRQRISEFRSQTVKKNYAFEIEGIPVESEYLEVRYAASFPPIPSDYSGKTIEHVFGTSVNALELLLIERDIKGPCWLEIKNPIVVEGLATWCKLQVNCLKMENLSVHKVDDGRKLSIPPMTVTTLNIRTSLNPKQQQNEIAMISVLSHNDFQIDKAAPKPPFQQHYCFITHPRNTSWPLYAVDKLKKFQSTNVIVCESESELLEKFLDKIQGIDPDILIGYDCGFQFDVLTRRLVALKVKNPSRTSKLKRDLLPFIKGKIMLQQIFCGRPICDLQICAKEVNLKVRNYDLDTLCSTVLNKKENHIKEIKPGNCPQFYSSSEKILGLVKIVMMETSYILNLICEMNIIPLALQITSIAGNVLSRTLSAGRAERNEFLLLHAFFKKGYITPDKRISNRKNEESTKKKAAYAGGLVLEPKKGFYDNLILLMDFNSLYPSIIQEYNMCFTTIPGVCYTELTDANLPGRDVQTGVIPTEIRKLVESRSEVKKLMKTPNLSPELKLQYNIRQLALKLTANSMYGCLGAAHCRFYAKHLAALVTAKGREILQNTKILVEKLNYDVVYGDTDSIMIKINISNYDEAFGVAKKIKQEVNKAYKKIELDIDGVFRYMLLLNKKKYAAVLMSKSASGKLEYQPDFKGLDIVRRDWCQLACDVGKQVIDHIFTEHAIEEKTAKIREYLEKIAANLRSQNIPLSSLVITKQLSKDPKDYPQKNQPHVAIALRLNKLGGRMWKAGDTVPYIICLDGTTHSPIERAYHIDEYKKSEDLTLDIDYYIINQIIAVLQRICTPIPELDGGFLAECLGVADKYKPVVSSSSYGGEDSNYSSSYTPKVSRFENCEPFVFKCKECGGENEVKKFLKTVGKREVPALGACSMETCRSAPWRHVKAVQNHLQMEIRRFVDKYYQQDLQCDNPECSYTGDALQLGCSDDVTNRPICPMCPEGELVREFTETMLYEQFSFYMDCFDVGRHGKDLETPLTPEVIAAYDRLKQFVEKYLRKNAYSIVDLSKVFLCIRQSGEGKDVKKKS
ncbi:DNA polymerase alpha catalytic subunit [Diachasma alloeum]|uniref:DNA polymerase alpha catalytic subunit n=1 Tax=Diachasma alloeum TaxID=454923 RepID=UPI0007383E34|nr:DNA polymerase alpha catalytic subunit [Diachasma alloeum]